MHEWLVAHGADTTEALRREYRRQAANQVSIGNCVTSLRLLTALDWNEFFEKSSLVEEVLRTEPTGVYVRQDFATRDRYRRAVEQLARGSHRPEVEVARRVVARAARAGTPVPPTLAGTSSAKAGPPLKPNLAIVPGSAMVSGRSSRTARVWFTSGCSFSSPPEQSPACWR